MSDPTSLSSDQCDIAVGQVWREVDPRLDGPFARYVKVIGFIGPFGVQIGRCNKDGHRLDEKVYRITNALRRRFNGKSGGYVRIS